MHKIVDYNDNYECMLRLKKKYEYVKVIKPKVWICVEVWMNKIVFYFIVKEWLVYVYDLITHTS